MRTVRSKDGTLIAYELSGAGSPLVLLHGSSADHTRWAPVLPGLGQHFAVYAVDRRGRGGSGDGAEYSLEREVDDILAVLASIGQPVDVLGHSYGGICALEAALPATNLRRLILYEPPIKTDSVDLYPAGVVAEMQGSLSAGDQDAAASLFLRAVARLSPREIEALQAAPAWAGRRAATHTILREMRCANAYAFKPARFARLTIPSLILLGGQSAPMFREAMARLREGLPNSQLVEFPGQEHAAMDTEPELFVQRVTEFLITAS
jgi:pimeloyl-ACP methyl ester carboxylesterase